MKEQARQARAENHIIGWCRQWGRCTRGICRWSNGRGGMLAVIASIFVNPKQFGPNEDFSKYPRTFESAAKNSSTRAWIFCLRRNLERLSRGFQRTQRRWLSEKLEGRPARTFSRVTTVVMKLYRSCSRILRTSGARIAAIALITQMARDLKSRYGIVVCPPVREPDGLALSSRNVYLNAESVRPPRFCTRAWVRRRASCHRSSRWRCSCKRCLQRTLAAERAVRVDYAEIVDAQR